MGIFSFIKGAVNTALPERTLDDITAAGLADMPEEKIELLVYRLNAEELPLFLAKARDASMLEKNNRIMDKANDALHTQNVIKLARMMQFAVKRGAELQLKKKAA
jgi:hypothetical protein